MAGQSFRSKLNPHLEFIRAARLREETWEAIAVKIRELGTTTDATQVCKFLKRRSQGKRPLGFAPEATFETPPVVSPLPIEEEILPPTRQKLVLKVTQPTHTP